jgi:nucleoside-diphosphate-sugar epimerase
MKHLVTGGSGFLGNLIVKRLIERNEQVRILDIWEDKNRPQEAEFVHCDIRDRAGVARAMQGIDIVHHNVALVPLTKSGKKFWEVNVDGSRIAAEEARNAGVNYFIHMSSSAIYGAPKQCPINPSTPLHPIEIYGRAKLAGETAVDEICEKSDMCLITIRPRTIVGAGRLGIFQILFDWIHSNRNIYVIGSGNNLLQFVHAHDLMDAYIMAMDSNKPGTYNVGTDRFGTLRQMLEALIYSVGSQSKVKSLPETITINLLRMLDWLRLSPLAPLHYLTYHKAFYFDIQPLLTLGWKPKYSNDEMLSESYQWFYNHLEEIKHCEAGSVHRTPVPEKILKLLKKFS